MVHQAFLGLNVNVKYLTIFLSDKTNIYSITTTTTEVVGKLTFERQSVDYNFFAIEKSTEWWQDMGQNPKTFGRRL